MSLRRVIKPIPREALEGLGITPTVSTQDEDAVLVSAASKPRRVYNIPPRLAAEVLADTQPYKLTYSDERHREIDDLAKVVADADARREAEEAVQRR